jgi:hypothetical protein
LKLLSIIAAVPAFVLSSFVPAWCQAQQGYARQSVYVGVSGNFGFTLEGTSFNGETAYKQVDGDELFILPRLDKQNALRGVLGFRAPWFGLEVSYDRSRHDGTYQGTSTSVLFNAINIDARVFFLRRHRIQPHALIGIAFPWVDVSNGSSLSGVTGEATYRGQGMNTEAGVTVFLIPRVGVSIGYTYRPIWFDRVRGVGGQEFQLKPRFRESSSNPVMMLFVAL